MREHLYALIMAGGGGTRLWPLSRRAHPKQMLHLFGKRTLFQIAVERLLPLLPPERILVVTGAEHAEALMAQVPTLPHDNFIIEPAGRGTAACIGLAAVHLHHRDPQATMAVLTADHFMRREDVFREVLCAAQEAAAQDYLVTLGIEPTYPATGYGYIRRGALLGRAGAFDYAMVEQFAEKPDAPTALAFVQDGRYSWNSGMFIWRTERILAEIARWLPDLRATLAALAQVWGTPEYSATLARLWPQVRKETIDYGVMEKAERIAVIPVDLGWSDVGAWSAVMDLHDSDAQGNVLVGDVIALDTGRTMVFASEGRLVATIGVQDLIVIDSPDALLIAQGEQVQRVREIVARLEAEGQTARL